MNCDDISVMHEERERKGGEPVFLCSVEWKEKHKAAPSP